MTPNPDIGVGLPNFIGPDDAIILHDRVMNIANKCDFVAYI
jgi:hypothetical protein